MAEGYGSGAIEKESLQKTETNVRRVTERPSLGLFPPGPFATDKKEMHTKNLKFSAKARMPVFTGVTA